MESQNLAGISEIIGVKSYYLLKHDGSQVAGKSSAATELCQYIALSGLNGEAICSLLGKSRLNHMIFSRQGKESIIIFPMKDHFLAVMKEAGTSTANLIPRISELIDGIKL
jgi:hypothetical protein